jgi:hypothetical protein
MGIEMVPWTMEFTGSQHMPLAHLLRNLGLIHGRDKNFSLLQGVKQLGCQADLSSPSGTEVKNATPPYVSMARWLMKHRGKFS